MALPSERAKQLIAEAERKEKSTSTFITKLFGDDRYKLSECAELYSQAGNLFKQSKMNNEAANAFMKAAGIYESPAVNSQYESQINYQNAALAFERSQPFDAIRVYYKLVDQCLLNGNFGGAAKQYERIADLTPGDQTDEIIKLYKLASECYVDSNQTYSGIKCLEKAVLIYIKQAKYAEASGMFEKLANMTTNISRYKISGYLFDAGLCYLVSTFGAANYDSTDTTIKFDSYHELIGKSDNRMSSLMAVATACAESDLVMFECAIRELAVKVSLSDWHIDILNVLKVKLKQIADGIL